MENKTVKFIGYTYVLQKADDDKSVCVCIDSEDTTGIVLMYFSPNDKENAKAASRALNIWAGMEDDASNKKPLLVKN